MALNESDENPKKHFIGGFVVAAGKTLKLETTPDGVEYVNELVPEGEAWDVVVNIRISRANSA